MRHFKDRVAVVIAFLLLVVIVFKGTAGSANAMSGSGSQEAFMGSSNTTESARDSGGSDFNPGRLLLKMVLGLVAVLGLLFLVGKIVAGRLGLPPGSAHYLAVLDTLPLGAGKGLLIVQAGKKQYLLGVGGDRITMLTELESADLTALSPESPEFAKVLAQTQTTKSNYWQQATDLIRHQVMRLRGDEHKGEGE
ncbi:MAG TPA: flagellar biosynthetic protein FliO [Firmicutes bacterium]|nr:flagellar biosynthetic protein FliO [Bacillota bacterium]